MTLWPMARRGRRGQVREVLVAGERPAPSSRSQTRSPEPLFWVWIYGYIVCQFTLPAAHIAWVYKSSLL
jgi:hypothetical protein